MAESNTQANPDNFFEFYRARLEFVKANCIDRIEGIILLCSYLDSLAGYRYSGSSSVVRFRRFLIEDTDHADTWRKVSLILLRQYVEDKNLQIYSKLIQVLNRLGAATSNFVNLSYNPDISFESLLTECKNELSSEQVATFKAEFKRFEYSAILWNAYRNASVHETAIQLNQAMNISQREVPFYSNQDIIEDGKTLATRTCFDIPQSFLISTIESGLLKLKELVDDGTCSLKLSTPYDRLAIAENEPKITNTCVTVKYPRIITKPFRPLLSDISNLLDQAKASHNLFTSTDEGAHRWREGAMSRSCIVTSVFFLESIVNCIIADFSHVEPYQLPDSILKKVGLFHQTLDRLPLIERVFLTPYLCCDDENMISKGFFDRGSKEFQVLKELIEIRDGFAHSRPVRRRMTLTKTGEEEFVANDKFKENFWPLTQFPKDIFIIDWNHANQAKEIVYQTVRQLDQFLDGRIVKNNWMSSEQIEFVPNKQ